MADPRSSIGGGIDLSYLKRDRAQEGQPPTAPTSPQNIKVPALVIEADAATLRGYLSLSENVPVLVYFHSDRAPESLEMLSELTGLVQNAAGKALLVKVDADKTPEIAQALGVSGLPSLIAVLKNQPAPLFAAVVPLEQIKLVFDKVMQVASENQLNGVLQVDASAEPASELAPKLSEHMMAGYEAMEASNFQAALQAFEAELNQNPANEEPKLAIEQVRFLERLSHFEIEPVLKAAKSSTIEDLLVLADATFAAVSPGEAFTLLLDRFASEDSKNRDLIRGRLISYFALVGNSDKSVSDARVRLANLLF